MKWFKNPFKKESRVVSVILKQNMGNTIYSEKDYENFAKETYLKNSVAFACIIKIAQAVSSVPWAVYEYDSNKEKREVFDTPMNKILNRANPRESFTRLMLNATSYLAMSGNTYFEKVGPETGPNREQAQELYVLRPDRMTIEKNDRGIVAFKYTVNNNSVTFDVDPITGQSNILHMKMFNPINDFYGAAITESVGREVDMSNEGIDWNLNLIRNEARPGMIFTYEGNLTDDQFDRLEKQLNDNHSGSNNAGKNIILEGVGQTKTGVSPYGFTPQELDFIESNRELARRICTAYGVPPQLIGITGDSTYSNYEQARLVFWEDTIFFYLNFFKNELNYWLMGEDSDLVIDYILDNVPAYVDKKMLQWERIDKLNSLSYNEKRELMGYEEIEGGDTLFISATMIPVSSEGVTDEMVLDEETQKHVDNLRKLGYSEDDIKNMTGFSDYEKI